MGERKKRILDTLWLATACMSGGIFVGYYFKWIVNPTWQQLAIQWVSAAGTFLLLYIAPRKIYRDIKESHNIIKTTRRGE